MMDAAPDPLHTGDGFESFPENGGAVARSPEGRPAGRGARLRDPGGGMLIVSPGTYAERCVRMNRYRGGYAPEQRAPEGETCT